MKKSIRRICNAIAAALVCIGAMQLAKANPAWVTKYYQPVSRQLCALLGRMSAFTTYSVAEMLLALLLLCLCAGIVFCVVRLFMGRETRVRALQLFSHMLALLATLLMLFVGIWGLNYCALPLSQTMALSEYTVSQDALEQAYAMCIARANEEALTADFNAFDDFDRMADDVREACETWMHQRVEGTHDLRVPRVKRVSSAYVMSLCGYTGVFSPFTGEANVNPDTYCIDIPMTMAHEAAHAMASAPEDETSFLSFLICRESTQGYIRYSAYYDAAIVLGNALFCADPAAAARISQTMGSALRAHMQETNAHYAPYEGSVQETAQQINDTYLKSMGQSAGVQSYGEAADLLVRSYLAQGRL